MIKEKVDMFNQIFKYYVMHTCIEISHCTPINMYNFMFCVPIKFKLNNIFSPYNNKCTVEQYACEPAVASCICCIQRLPFQMYLSPPPVLSMVFTQDKIA
jgi:hypothetical protein